MSTNADGVGAESFLDGHQVVLSISESDDAEKFGTNEEQLNSTLLEVSRQLLARGAALRYGGHLGNEGYTVALFEMVETYRNQSALAPGKRVINDVGWPLPLTKMPAEKLAKFEAVADFRRVPRPGGVADLEPETFVEEPEFFPANSPERRYAWARGMTAMREHQAKSREVIARIVLGGKFGPLDGSADGKWYMGRIPGVVEEVLGSLKTKQPVFLIGAFGGAARLAIDLLEGRDRDEFSWEFQKNAPHAEAMKSIFDERGPAWESYESMSAFLAETGVAGLANGLTIEENRELFESRDTARIVELIIQGLCRLSESAPSGFNAEFAGRFETIKSEVAKSKVGGAEGADKKDDKGFVTLADFLISFDAALMVDRLFPDDHFLSEESFGDEAIERIRQLLARDSDLETRYAPLVDAFLDLRSRRPDMFEVRPDRRIWVIDPIDGTSNYVSGNPAHAGSLACLEPDSAGKFRTVAGCVVMDPDFELTIDGQPHREILVQLENGRVSIFSGRNRVAADFRSPASGPRRICLRDSVGHGPNTLRPKLDPGYLDSVEVEPKWASSVVGLLEVLVGGQFSGYAGYMSLWDHALIAPALQAAAGRKDAVRRLADGSVLDGFTIDDLNRARQKDPAGLPIAGAIGEHADAFSSALA